MRHLYEVWITPRLELTPLDEMLMAGELVVAILVLAAACFWLKRKG